jgi:hypothetical protein
MTKLKSLIAATAMMAAGPALADSWSSEADMSQGIRNGNIAFTRQMQNRGFFAVPGFFAPGLTNGYVGNRNYRGARFTGGPGVYNVPGSMDTNARPRAYYNEPMAYRNRNWR